MTKAKVQRPVVGRRDVYEQVRDRIVTFIETNGTTPWRKPWKAAPGGGCMWPKNATTDRPYRGINAVLLSMLDFDYPLYMTYKQAEKAGLQVRRGSTGTPVVFWAWLKKKEEGGGKADGDDPKAIPFLRRYTVFNVEQIDGAEVFVPKEEEPAGPPFVPIDKCEQVVRDYLANGGPGLIHRGSRACYSPARDKVRVPPPESFESPEAYYGTLFHELVHSTGHGLRVARKGITGQVNFGSHTYGKEELVAEIGSAFLCAVCGVDPPPLRDNQAAYVSSWLRTIKEDPKLVVLAAAQAQRAADWILGNREEVRDAA